MSVTARLNGNRLDQRRHCCPRQAARIALADANDAVTALIHALQEIFKRNEEEVTRMQWILEIVKHVYAFMALLIVPFVSFISELLVYVHRETASGLLARPWTLRRHC